MCFTTLALLLVFVSWNKNMTASLDPIPPLRGGGKKNMTVRALAVCFTSRNKTFPKVPLVAVCVDVLDWTT